VTTATRRLRRASVAGLATIATAAVAVAASGGPAFAFGATGASLGGGSTTAVVFPGQAAQALTDVTLALTNGTWSSGDFVTFTLSSAAAVTPLCNTASNLNKSASFSAAPTDTAVDSGGATVAAATISLGATGNCNVNDKFTFALPASPSDTGTTTFTITGLKLTLGSAIAPSNVFLSAVASNGTPFAGSVTAAKQEGLIGTNSVTVSPVVGAANGTSGVAISPIVVTDVTGGTLTVGVKFTAAAGDTFATAGTLTPPSGVTITGPSETVPAATLTYLIAAGTVPAGGKFTLTGATVNLANAASSHKVTVGTGAGEATLVGGATEYAVTAAELRTFAGIDRYGTARALYHAQFAGATVAVVASGANFPDALSAGVIAKKNNTGILLTSPTVLSQDTQQELQADPIATVYIIGGTAAVSGVVEKQIRSLHVSNVTANPLINVVRLQGADRYATNNAVNLTAGPTGGRAVIATGTNFADALAVGPLVYDQNYALVLTDPNTLTASASSTLTNLGITHVVIAGGTSAVSAAVETALKTSGITIDYRIAGADRTATAAMVATWALAGLPASGSYGALAAPTGALWTGGVATFFLTRGDLFADALAAGPVGGAQHHVLILTGNPSTLGAGAATYLGGKAGTITTVSTLGFAAAVTPATVNAAVAALG
jgi:putative cell wall-binding protein